jgi:hypothetical protein
MSPGGSMGLGNIFPTLTVGIIAKLLLFQQPLKLERKNKHIFGIFRILAIFGVCLTIFKSNQILLLEN